MNQLKLLRKERNISQKELAKIFNISQNGYSQYETEKRTMPVQFLIKLADYFDVSIDFILGLTNIKQKYSKSKIIYSKNMNRLREIREDKDLTQNDIAIVLDMSRTGYCDYETGCNNIQIFNLIKLAIYYNVPIDYILYLTDERIPHKRKANFI